MLTVSTNVFLNFLFFLPAIVLFLYVFKRVKTTQLKNIKNELLDGINVKIDGFKSDLLDPIYKFINTDNIKNVRDHVGDSLRQHAELLSGQVGNIRDEVRNRIKEMTEKVEKSFSDGFSKTDSVFMNIRERLAVIDQAQEKIHDLSRSIVSLQDILQDKRSRGAFGETQLNILVKNVLPNNLYKFQYTLSNGKRADCILFFPQPTGHIVIDAKFPLESFRKMIASDIPDFERTQLSSSFANDIKRHIRDISSKYIIQNETADSAMMFIPSSITKSAPAANAQNIHSQHQHIYV